MNLKHAIPAIGAATLLMGAASFASAEPQDNSRASTYGSGAAAAGAKGAVAGGVSAGTASQRDRNGRRDRRDRDDRNAVAPSSTSTYGSGAVHTERGSGSAAVTSGAAATGSGSNAAGTTVDAYSETTRGGSSADIYGNSTATSEPQRRRD